MKQSNDRRIFEMGVTIHGEGSLHVETAPARIGSTYVIHALQIQPRGEGSSQSVWSHAIRLRSTELHRHAYGADGGETGRGNDPEKLQLADESQNYRKLSNHAHVGGGVSKYHRSLKQTKNKNTIKQQKNVPYHNLLHEFCMVFWRKLTVFSNGLIKIIPYGIETWTKLSTFCRRHSRMHFCWNICIWIKLSLKFVPKIPKRQ